MSQIKKITDYVAGLVQMPFIASRRLDAETGSKFDTGINMNWTGRNILPPSEVVPASGFGYVSSPYTSQYTKLWGQQSSADLIKFRTMVNTIPVIRTAINKKVATSISKGFKLEGDEAAVEYLESWIYQQQDFNTTLQTLVFDTLVYGTGFMELVYEDNDITEEVVNYGNVELPTNGPVEVINGVPQQQVGTYNITNVKSKHVTPKGNPVWMKNLDPMYMRVRHDTYGNVFGYLQFLSSPPVSFNDNKIICVKYNPSSVFGETVYGVSSLKAVIRTQEMIWSLENDLMNIAHSCSKPPLVFSCGTEEAEPWTQPQLDAFVTSTNNRGSGGDVYHRGDVKTTPLPFPANSLLPLITYLNYHVEQRMMLLGTPPDLLGFKGGSNRSTAMVTFDDWINTIQIIQEQLGEALEEQLLKRIIVAKFGENVKVPKIVWNELYTKDESAQVNTVTTLIAAGLITPDEGRAKLREVGWEIDAMPKIEQSAPAAKVDEGEVNTYLKSSEEIVDSNPSSLTVSSLMYPELLKKKKVVKKASKGKTLDDFDPKEVEMGIEVEKEHSETVNGDMGTIKKIVLDQLNENSHYYTKLKKCEL